jgi:hypothetical protein
VIIFTVGFNVYTNSYNLCVYYQCLLLKWMLSELVHTNLYKNVHAGNESVDGRMTACDDKIVRRTTTQQPTDKCWSGGGSSGSGSGSGSGRGGGGSLVAARRRQQRGSGAQRNGSAAAAHSATAAAWWQQLGGCGSNGSAAAAGNGWGNDESNGDQQHRTRGWHNERTERGNATTSWARGTSTIQFLSCNMNLCELVHTNL